MIKIRYILCLSSYMSQLRYFSKEIWKFCCFISPIFGVGGGVWWMQMPPPPPLNLEEGFFFFFFFFFFFLFSICTPFPKNLYWSATIDLSDPKIKVSQIPKTWHVHYLQISQFNNNLHALGWKTWTVTHKCFVYNHVNVWNCCKWIKKTSVMIFHTISKIIKLKFYNSLSRKKLKQNVGIDSKQHQVWEHMKCTYICWQIHKQDKTTLSMLLDLNTQWCWDDSSIKRMTLYSIITAIS